jgi:hypothetical protein
VKRFSWRLQRVLDVTEQRERLMEAELLALAQRVVLARQGILARQALVRMLLADLGRRPLADRLAEQTLVLECARTEQRTLDDLRAKLKDLEDERQRATERLMEVRTRRRMLERLRDEARRRHDKEMDRLEQAALDEAAHLAHARRDPAETAA